MRRTRRWSPELEPFLAELNAPSVRRQRAGVERLVSLGKVVVPDLVEVVRSHPNAYVRSGALRALARLDGAEARGTFLLALRDPAMTVRLPALGALERTWDPRVSLAVRRALATDVSGAVRLAATGVLVRRKQRSAVRGLLRALSDDKWYVRQHAAMALGELGAGEARRALERAVDDPRKAVREAARNSLRRILER